MKKLLIFSVLFVSLSTLTAQANGKYSFYAKSSKNIDFTVKGEYVGRFEGSDYYYEKIDALNHKVKEVELSSSKLRCMNFFEVNETLIGVSNLRVKETKSGDKIFYMVEVKPNNDKKPIMFKYYSASKGAFDPEMQPKYTLNIPFATKAKAEAFIADLKTLFK